MYRPQELPEDDLLLVLLRWAADEAILQLPQPHDHRLTLHGSYS